MFLAGYITYFSMLLNMDPLTEEIRYVVYGYFNILQHASKSGAFDGSDQV